MFSASENGLTTCPAPSHTLPSSPPCPLHLQPQSCRGKDFAGGWGFFSNEVSWCFPKAFMGASCRGSVLSVDGKEQKSTEESAFFWGGGGGNYGYFPGRGKKTPNQKTGYFPAPCTLSPRNESGFSVLPQPAEPASVQRRARRRGRGRGRALPGPGPAGTPRGASPRAMPGRGARGDPCGMRPPLAEAHEGFHWVWRQRAETESRRRRLQPL